MNEENITTKDTDLRIFQPSSEMLVFEKDGKYSYFDYKDGKWQFWGDVSVDESAKLLFEKLGQMINFEKYRKDNENINQVITPPRR